MNTAEATADLTDADRSRITRNRQLAEQLLSSKIVGSTHAHNPVLRRSKVPRTLVSSGGFIPESDCSVETPRFEKDEEQSDNESESHKRPRRRGKRVNVSPDGRLLEQSDDISVPIPADQAKPECDLCQRTFDDSFLRKNFDVYVCDRCRDPKGIHSLITRSTAKERYLLNEVDLDVREPKLRFILKRNPHNSSWGDMRLYLEAQVAERALSIWGSDEALELERERRLERIETSNLKKYNKKLKELKLQTRSSLFVKTRTKHEHTFGPEAYDALNDVYTKKCTQCSFVSSFEKM